MKTLCLSLSFLLALAAATQAFAAGPVQAPCQHCGVHHECKLVPETKQIKKTVYEVREIPFCLHKLPPLLGHHGGCCDACRECGCVRYKKVLFKKEVVCEEICTTRCVVEERGPKYALPASAPATATLTDQELVPIPLPQVRR
jgi:hypothetical protein